MITLTILKKRSQLQRSERPKPMLSLRPKRLRLMLARLKLDQTAKVLLCSLVVSVGLPMMMPCIKNSARLVKLLVAVSFMNVILAVPRGRF
jgi:hypothetical protein